MYSNVQDIVSDAQKRIDDGTGNPNELVQAQNAVTSPCNLYIHINMF